MHVEQRAEGGQTKGVGVGVRVGVGEKLNCYLFTPSLRVPILYKLYIRVIRVVS